MDANYSDGFSPLVTFLRRLAALFFFWSLYKLSRVREIAGPVHLLGLPAMAPSRAGITRWPPRGPPSLSPFKCDLTDAQLLT